MAAQSIITEMSDKELELHAFSVLARELGLAGYVRFLRLFGVKRGDYTAERQQNPDPRTLDEIWHDLEAKGYVQNPDLQSVTPPR